MDPNQIQVELAKKRQELGQRSADIPKIYGQYNPESDATLGALRSQQAEKLKELFAHDQQLADVYFQPQPAPGGEAPPLAEAPRLIDPTIGLRASSQQTQAAAGEVADILNQIGVRKDYLSSERDKTLAILDRALQINDREVKGLENQLSLALEEKKNKADTILNVLGETGGAITPEIAALLGVPELAGKTIPSKYSTPSTPQPKAPETIETEEGIFQYDASTGGWKPIMGVDKKPLKIKTKKTAQQQKLLQQDVEMANIVRQLNKYQSDWLNTNIKERVDPTNKKGIQLKTSSNLFAQQIGKYIEVGGRGLTDKDREFYRSQLPDVYNPLDELFPGRVEGSIAGVKESILGKAGYLEVIEIASGRRAIIRNEEFDPSLYKRI